MTTREPSAPIYPIGVDDQGAETAGSTGTDQAVELHLTVKDIALLRTGLEMLQDTLGHEEAEELEEVQALLAKLPSVGKPAL